MQKMIPLKDLRYGQDATPPVNVRKMGRDENVDSLAASIEAHGMGQALNIVETKGKFGPGNYVEDGNRRLKALLVIEKRGNITKETLIKCEVSEKDGLVPGELGLALNFERVPMHEADQYEKFWELHEAGLTDEQIASRFGLEVKRVRKFLALGKLSPVILDDWRNDELQRPVDILQALTLAPNVKEQEAVYKRLKKSGQLYANTIRAAFGTGDNVVAANLKFVGRETYEKAGGKIVEDLFQERHLVSDAALLQKLAEQKIDSKLDGLIADGWSWAKQADDLPYYWSHGWQKVKGGKKASAADKAKSGCAVAVKDDGTFEITYGVIRPEEKKQAPASAPTKGPEAAAKGPARLSGALEHSLAIMASKATREALKAEPAASPLAGLLATVVGQQIDINTSFHTPSAVTNQMKAIRDFISAPVMDAAARKAFDADRYFKAAPMEFVLKAIKEAVNPEQAKKLSTGTKSAAWKFALANVPKTGWLPPELRASTYAGPGAKEAKPKAEKKAPLKKAA